MTLLEDIIQQIEVKNPRHAKKLRANLTGLEKDFYVEAEDFFQKYLLFAKKVGKNLEYAIDSYLKVVSDTLYEQIRFAQTGEYTCKSFDDAYERVYNNPEVMEYYMHGLIMTQFLWKHHYTIVKFFRNTIPKFNGKVDTYLEIGGGHGAYLDESIDFLSSANTFHMVDISESSLNMAKQFVKSPNVKYFLQDIYTYKADGFYDFVTMGEVLEHVEDPVSLMVQIYRLLKDGGHAFITTPANAPAIDHISLFRNADEIREIFHKAGFKVIEDIEVFTENMPKEKAEKLKIPLMYGALIQKINK